VGVLGIPPSVDAPEFGMPALGIPELLLLEDEEPGLGIEGIDEPEPELPPELLLCEPPGLLELDEDEPLLEDELPAEPDDPEDEDDEGGDDEGIDEDDCCCCSQPPISNAPVAPAAAICSASMHARFSVTRFCVLLTIASPARESNAQTARGGAADYVGVELNRA
jgi:hypothetical protein